MLAQVLYVAFVVITIACLLRSAQTPRADRAFFVVGFAGLAMSAGQRVAERSNLTVGLPVAVVGFGGAVAVWVAQWLRARQSRRGGDGR